MEISVLTLVLILVACAAIGFQETGTPFGLVFPTASTIGIVTAAVPSQSLAFVWAAIVFGAVIGHSVAVFLGRRAPESIVNTVRQRVPKLVSGINRYGAAILVVTRFVPVLRTIAPSALGCLAAPPLRNVVPFSFAGACLWSAVLVSGGKAITEAMIATGLSRTDVVACTFGLAAAGLTVASFTLLRHRLSGTATGRTPVAGKVVPCKKLAAEMR
ncbi:hypothetical protein QM797_17215 [Rhodococcus sp. IEGM 1381]|uniref:DedA family protein n=1 Tax=Rhodococcus sp. IEGM 1381 TaxID=3047085 RepID=UPI0024B7D3DC|nr:VTT domain-containing protein [Rhodococcus sp. IEGM 1381]MDI9896467.1 hypothetical protein [Rhodococcus sp. IEGM 1381]